MSKWQIWSEVVRVVAPEGLVFVLMCDQTRSSRSEKVNDFENDSVVQPCFDSSPLNNSTRKGVVNGLVIGNGHVTEGACN